MSLFCARRSCAEFGVVVTLGGDGMLTLRDDGQLTLGDAGIAMVAVLEGEGNQGFACRIIELKL